MNETKEYKKFVSECIQKSRESIQAGRGKSAEEVFHGALKAILNGSEQKKHVA